jgi:hypothetical protein
MKGKKIWLVLALALVFVFAMSSVALASWQVDWVGNGDEHNLANGTQHWVLTSGGAGAYTGATLYVKFVGDADFTPIVASQLNGNGNGSAFFYVEVGDAVVDEAYAMYDGSCQQKNAVLTISGWEGEETTTTLEETTTTLEETTTTLEETTTTVGGLEETTTTVGGLEETTTTAGNITTVSEIQTGGGGTSGPGTGTWALGILALALAGGLGWTAVRPALKRK